MPSEPGEALIGWVGLGAGTLLVYSAVKNKAALTMAGDVIKTGNLPAGSPSPSRPGGPGSTPGGAPPSNSGNLVVPDVHNLEKSQPKPLPASSSPVVPFQAPGVSGAPLGPLTGPIWSLGNWVGQGIGKKLWHWAFG